jgi:hypothetical protein
MDTTKKTFPTLETLNLSETDKTIFSHLLNNGDKSAQEIATATNLGRTVVYKSLERLQNEKLVFEVINKNGRVFEARANSNLDYLLFGKKSELISLEDSLPDLIESLSEIAFTNVKKSKIKYYTGQAGLEQITWNSTKADKVFRIYEIDDIDSLVGQKLADETMIEYAKKHIFDRQLTNQKELDDCSTNPAICDFIDNWWEGRYVDPKEVNIQFETMIYNDVYCVYEYQNGTIFCVEIYNEKLAETQKEIFDFIYNTAKPLRKLNSFAHAKIDE